MKDNRDFPDALKDKYKNIKQPAKIVNDVDGKYYFQSNKFMKNLLTKNFYIKMLYENEFNFFLQHTFISVQLYFDSAYFQVYLPENKAFYVILILYP